jgi:hypothetical protein
VARADGALRSGDVPQPIFIYDAHEDKDGVEGFRVTECREAAGDRIPMVLAFVRTRAIL